MTKKLSIIVPCYYEEETIPLFYEAVEKVKKELNGIELEYWFVNDGSQDGTLDEMRKLNAKDKEHVHYVSFSRNFGKEAALYCGLQQATGDYITVMDADLQDPPDMLPEMIEILENEDYDCVGTRRTNRKGEPPIRSFFARMFYKLINKISDTEIVDGARDFRVMTRQMVDAILSMTEYNRFSKGIFGWIGFKTYWLPFKNVERVAGETKWNFWKLFKYAIDGIINFSEAPLSIASWAGIGMTFIAFIMMVIVIVRRLCFGDPVAGWASTMCVIIFIGAIQLFSMGIMGQYIAKTYNEAKHRPHYIVAESNGEKVKRIK